MRLAPGTIIVNADDFGMSSAVNRAILTCFQRRLISSATIMANMPAFEEACSLAIANGLTESIGIHVNLTDGVPLVAEVRNNPSLCNAAGRFRRFRPRFLTRHAQALIRAEVTAQIKRCRTAGLPLSHADSHQHVHTEPMVFLAMRAPLKEQGIRHLRLSRNMDPLPRRSPKQIAKLAFNQVIVACGFRRTDYFGSVSNFEQFQTADKIDGASFEILTHPSYDDSGSLVDHVEGGVLIERLREVFKNHRLSSYSSAWNDASELVGRRAA